MNKNHWKEISEEVFYTENDIVTVNQSDIAFLKDRALKNKRRRSRLCSHKNINDSVQEMLIVHTNDTYVRPHKHIEKSESFHVVEGAVDVIIFDENGEISEVMPMGDYSSGKTFYYRISHELYHTVVITSPVAVFHECTKGPFRKGDMVCAPWSVSENDKEAALTYFNDLIKRKNHVLRLDSQRKKEAYS